MVKRNAFARIWGILLVAAAVLALAGPATAAPPLEGAFADSFKVLAPPARAPLEPMSDLEGNAARLTDFEGRVTVLNFWATWCAPCVREMPSLDRLQAAFPRERLAVVTVSLDRQGAEVVAPFIEKHGLKNLAFYLDPKMKLAQAFGLVGVPTTYILDRQTRVLGVMQSDAEWDSPEAKTLIKHYLKEGAERQDAQESAPATSDPPPS